MEGLFCTFLCFKVVDFLERLIKCTLSFLLRPLALRPLFRQKVRGGFFVFSRGFLGLAGRVVDLRLRGLTGQVVGTLPFGQHRQPGQWRQ